MKNARKLTSILLLIAMLFMIAAPAMAANDGRITITNTTEGEKYTIYKVFDLTYANPTTEGEAKKISYTFTKTTSNTELFNALDDEDSPFTLTATSDANVYQVTSSTTDGAAIGTWLKANESLLGKGTEKTAGKDDLVFDGIAYGYYYVTSSVGSVVSVNSAAKDVTIADKNTAPTIDKQVQEDSLQNSVNDTVNGWQDRNDADIDQVVNFKTTVHAKAGAKGYVVHDVMSDGLSLVTTGENAPKVQVTMENGTVETLNATTDYILNTNPGCEHDGKGKCDFTITFTEAYLDGIDADRDIVITYSATLNENAKIGSAEGNPNETALKYGEDTFTTWDKTVTYTWNTKVYKYTGNGDAATPLAGAKFKLTTDKAGNNVVKFSAVTGENIANTYQRDDDGQVEEFITDETGDLFFQGLDEGTYYLHEIEAPAGYNKLTGEIEVTISHVEDTADTTKYTHTISYKMPNDTTVTTPEDKTIGVQNNSGTELPSTGGIGTTIFYVVGAALVVGAGVLLVTKKRMTGQR